MKPSLQFRLSQHLTLTPQLQQSIRVAVVVELNQEIERIMENPALEREEPDRRRSRQGAAAGSSIRTVDWPSEAAANWRGPEDDEDGDRTHATPDTPTLRDRTRPAVAH